MHLLYECHLSCKAAFFSTQELIMYVEDDTSSLTLSHSALYVDRPETLESI